MSDDLMKRYDPDRNAPVYECDDGDFVYYTDHIKCVEELEAKLAKAVDGLTQIERAYYQEATNPSPETVRRMAARMNGIARDTQNALAELTTQTGSK